MAYAGGHQPCLKRSPPPPRSRPKTPSWPNMSAASDRRWTTSIAALLVAPARAAADRGRTARSRGPGKGLVEFCELLKSTTPASIGRSPVPRRFRQGLHFRQEPDPPGDTPKECGLPKEKWIDLQESDYIPRRNRTWIWWAIAASNGSAADAEYASYQPATAIRWATMA